MCYQPCANGDVCIAAPEQASEWLEKAEFWTEPHSFGETTKQERMSFRVHVLIVRGELLRRYVELLVSSAWC